MKKVHKGKIVFWLLVIVLASVTVFQNQDFFFQKQKLSIDLFVTHFNVPPTPIALLFIITFFIGFFIAFFFGFLQRYRLNKTITGLNNNVKTLNAQLGEQKRAEDKETGETETSEQIEAGETEKVEGSQDEQSPETKKDAA